MEFYSDRASERDAVETPQVSDSFSLERRIQQAEDHRARDTSDKAIPEVHGFDKSALWSKKEVESDLHENFPPEHLNGSLKDIEYVDETRVNGKGQRVLGVNSYSPIDGRSEIEIYHPSKGSVAGEQALKETLSHEIGHSVYWDTDQSVQTEWGILSRQSAPHEYVSSYAQTGGEREDFAESYSAYIRDPALLEIKSVGKYEFMRDKIFNGKEYKK